jgi:RNA recognition motif-containing protein
MSEVTIRSAPFRPSVPKVLKSSFDVSNISHPVAKLTGSSYQDALKAANPRHQPQYVFPQYAPSKSSQQNTSGSSSTSSSGGISTSPSFPTSNSVSSLNSSHYYSSTSNPAAPVSSVSKPVKYVRKAAGQVWEDPTLSEWNPNDYRIFVGDLGNEVNDDQLTRTFNKYASFQKARVVRDKRSGKTKGFGFVSFGNPNDFASALKEMNGKYIGNRPCKLRKSTWKDRNAEEELTIRPSGISKASKEKNKKRKTVPQ